MRSGKDRAHHGGRAKIITPAALAGWILKLEPEDIKSVNGYSVLKSGGTFTVHEIDERDGLRQVGPCFDTFQAAAEYVLSLTNSLQNPGV
jgi:hypothetical protein